MEGIHREPESLRLLREGLEALMTEHAGNLVCTLSFDDVKGKHRIFYTYAEPTGITVRRKVRKAVGSLIRDDARDVCGVEEDWNRERDTVEIWFSLRSQQEEKKKSAA